jgi:signal transduction histidine kinase
MASMTARRSLESVIKRTTSRPFRYKFSIFYIGIVGVVTILRSLSTCKSSTLIPPAVSIGWIVLGLLAFELLELTRFGQRVSGRLALALLATRMVLIEGAVALDCNEIAIFLYPMAAYSAYFSFGGWAGLVISFFYTVLFTWRIRLDNPGWFLDPEATSYIVVFTIVMLFGPLVAHIIRRDDENRRRTETLLSDLEASHIKLQTYTGQVAELAAVEERNRLARDIHDSLGHYLTAVNIQLEKALLYQERNPAEATQAIRDAKQAAADALRDVRRSVGTLRNANEHFSLVDSLQKLVHEMDSDDLTITFAVQGEESAYPRSTLIALYRAAQEGLTNVQKHAHARQVDLAIRLGEQEAELVLRDDGQGFDPQILHQPRSVPQLGFGLRGIQERLDLVRGQLSLQSKPRKGTVLSVTVPRAADIPQPNGQATEETS